MYNWWKVLTCMSFSKHFQSTLQTANVVSCWYRVGCCMMSLLPLQIDYKLCSSKIGKRFCGYKVYFCHCKTALLSCESVCTAANGHLATTTLKLGQVLPVMFHRIAGNWRKEEIVLFLFFSPSLWCIICLFICPAFVLLCWHPFFFFFFFNGTVFCKKWCC